MCCICAAARRREAGACDAHRPGLCSPRIVCFCVYARVTDSCRLPVLLRLCRCVVRVFLGTGGVRTGRSGGKKNLGSCVGGELLKYLDVDGMLRCLLDRKNTIGK